MRFEVINPSDACEMEACDFKTAAVAVCLLGEGRYGLDGLDGEHEVPIFLLGGSDEWFTATFGESFESCLDAAMLDPSGLLAALDSVRLRGRRTSLNDIVLRAKSIAKSIREIEAARAKEPTP